jgi:hypothetical protein
VKFVLKLLLFVVCFFSVGRFCKKQTDGFTVASTQFDLPRNPDWATLERAVGLEQKFTYLGRGAQSYVFASEDGQYVLKLFRKRYLRKSRREAKLVKEFNSYKLAYDVLRKETALVYLHLNKTTHLRQKITLVDRLGIEHPLDADQTYFLVQKKAELLYPGLEKLAREEKIEAAKEALTRLVGLLVTRCQKGIFDKDPDLNTNFGLLKEEPVQIDIGRFKKDLARADANVYREEVRRVTDHLHQWLMVRYPELDDHLRKKLDEI